MYQSFLQYFKKLIITLSEFGETCNDFKYTESVINEYGKLLIEKNAIKELK